MVTACKEYKGFKEARLLYLIYYCETETSWDSSSRENSYLGQTDRWLVVTKLAISALRVVGTWEIISGKAQN